MFSKFSGLKALYHLDHVKATLNGEHTFPVHINVDLTNYCNHHCTWCSQYESHQEKATAIDYDILLQALKDAAENSLKAITYIGSGDSTVYPKFLELTREVAKMGVDQGIFTHGDFPNKWCEELVNTFTWIRFSLDAATTETHNKVHGVDNRLDNVLKNIKTLIEKRKGSNYMTVGVQFGLHQLTVQEMVPCAKLVKELGVDYFAVKPIYKRGAVEITIDRYALEWENVCKNIDLLKILEDNTFEVLYKPYQFQINNAPYAHDIDVDPDFTRNYDRCYAPNFEWWIRTNLNVDICGPMKLSVGNLGKQSYKSILGSPRYLQLLTEIDINKCYRGCRPHYHNEVMHSLANPDFKTHINFVG